MNRGISVYLHRCIFRQNANLIRLAKPVTSSMELRHRRETDSDVFDQRGF
jgi:hypothetical protein